MNGSFDFADSILFRADSGFSACSLVRFMDHLVRLGLIYSGERIAGLGLLTRVTDRPALCAPNHPCRLRQVLHRPGLLGTQARRLLRLRCLGLPPAQRRHRFRGLQHVHGAL